MQSFAYNNTAQLFLEKVKSCEDSIKLLRSSYASTVMEYELVGSRLEDGFEERLLKLQEDRLMYEKQLDEHINICRRSIYNLEHEVAHKAFRDMREQYAGYMKCVVSALGTVAPHIIVRATYELPSDIWSNISSALSISFSIAGVLLSYLTSRDNMSGRSNEMQLQTIFSLSSYDFGLYLTLFGIAQLENSIGAFSWLNPGFVLGGFAGYFAMDSLYGMFGIGTKSMLSSMDIASSWLNFLSVAIPINFMSFIYNPYLSDMYRILDIEYSMSVFGFMSYMIGDMLSLYIFDAKREYIESFFISAMANEEFHMYSNSFNEYNEVTPVQEVLSAIALDIMFKGIA